MGLPIVKKIVEAHSGEGFFIQTRKKIAALLA